MSAKAALVFTVCTAATFSSLVACSSGADNAGGKPQGPPSVSSTPTLASAADKALPIEAYMMTADQYRKIDMATLALQTSCMKRYGFDYRPTPAAYGGMSQVQTVHRYGPVDLAAASQHGYHREDVPQAAAKLTTPKISDAMFAVLGSGSGPHIGPATPATYNGLAVPKGGCVGESEDKLGIGGEDIGIHGVAEQIAAGGFTHSMADDRVKAAFADWSACMKADGYSYATPNDAVNDSRWAQSAQPSSAEIAAATADVKCKQKTNVIGVWYSVESAYELQAIDQHSQELAAIKKNIDDALRKADTAAAAAN